MNNRFLKYITVLKSLLFILVFLIVNVHSIEIIHAQNKSPSKKLEDFIIASHFYVISYTKWNNIEIESIKVCVDPSHKLAENIIDTLSRKKISDKSLTLVLINTIEEIDSCNVVILGGDDEINSKILSKIYKTPNIITMSSEADITKNNGDVYLISGKPPKFNMPSLKKKGIQIDSSMLAISEIIE